MEISFGDARLCAVFNSFRLLCNSYGRDVAHSIIIRMGVLAAAPSLVTVPRKPPISLKAEEGTYSVTLARARRLRFQPWEKGNSASIELEKITAIEIIGVEA
ncbi:hypothetical protein GA0061098_104524 [Bradyrhizobium shewense]|uniref:Proteic killer suppression protein n=1 Tax=Bradyrhizobium shewense TaxID=1761772 RepID=A0A1C3XTK1_9BRAD|nr:hypothetical protein [Bradyrhizobium shewense]SCB55578.1 hypothetical protein GA0061098_104524 [Bradyrhizobium shewense]